LNAAMIPYARERKIASLEIKKRLDHYNDIKQPEH
jgi:hypothetical protein